MEVARRLNLKLPNAANQFGRWKRGNNKPNYDQTMRLLDIAGLVMLPAERDEVLGLLRQIREMDPGRDEQVEALESLQRTFESPEWQPQNGQDHSP